MNNRKELDQDSSASVFGSDDRSVTFSGSVEVPVAAARGYLEQWGQDNRSKTKRWHERDSYANAIHAVGVLEKQGVDKVRINKDQRLDRALISAVRANSANVREAIKEVRPSEEVGTFFLDHACFFPDRLGTKYAASPGGYPVVASFGSDGIDKAGIVFRGADEGGVERTLVYPISKDNLFLRVERETVVLHPEVDPVSLFGKPVIAQDQGLDLDGQKQSQKRSIGSESL